LRRAVGVVSRAAVVGVCLTLLLQPTARSFISSSGPLSRKSVPAADREGRPHHATVGLRQAPSDTKTSTADADEVAVAAVPERSGLVQAWGVLGVIAYLSFGVFKVVPIVFDGLSTIQEPWQWALLAVVLTFFAYVEGYKGFQLGFSPRVVSRSWCVSQEAEDAPSWHKILAPAFCIGYFHGTNKRVIASWAITTVIFAVVIGVKQLDNPYRAIIDAGVIVGLVWGIISILVIYAQSVLSEEAPDYDPSLPEETPYTPPPFSA